MVSKRIEKAQGLMLSTRAVIPTRGRSHLPPSLIFQITEDAPVENFNATANPITATAAIISHRIAFGFALLSSSWQQLFLFSFSILAFGTRPCPGMPNGPFVLPPTAIEADVHMQEV